MFTSFSAVEKDLRNRIAKAEDRIIDFVKLEFKNEVNFKKTTRDGKEIELDTSLAVEKKPGILVFSIKASKADILLLKEDEIGVGSKGIKPKATILKLKNSIRSYSKKLGGTEKV
jgi:hypothetical protein